MSQLQEQLEAGKFAVTGEIGPPKGTNVEPLLEEAEKYLKGRVLAVNVTDIQTAVMRLGSMAVCHLLRDRGIEPVFQMVCRDRNRLALQSDLLSAHVLGIENVLALTGDHNVLGDHPDSKPVFDLEAVGLLQCVRTLCEGRDMAGNELDGAPEFFPGAVVAPASEPVEMQIIRMQKKIAAGARFFQTQAVYDVEQFAEFMEQVSGLGVPVLCGIVLLKSVGMARFMNAIYRPFCGFIAIGYLTDKFWGQVMMNLVPGFKWTYIERDPLVDSLVAVIIYFFFGYRQRSKEKAVANVN